MTAPVNDTWKCIREMFPEEHARHSEILEYIRIHPGCRNSEIRANLEPCDAAGLIRVLIQMYKDGDIRIDHAHRFYPRGCSA